MHIGKRFFAAVSVVDFEYGQSTEGLPEVRCMVVHDPVSGRWTRLWRDDLDKLKSAPFDCGPDSVVVAYYAAAEMLCFRELNWPEPFNVIDLYAEFRSSTNGLRTKAKLTDALKYHGLSAMEDAHKNEMRQLALRGGMYEATEKCSLIDYCAEDVESTGRLLCAMAPTIDVDHALLRGRFTVSVARMEDRGIPIDAALLRKFFEHRDGIRNSLIEGLDSFGIFEDGSFRMARLNEWAAEAGITWPRTKTGQLKIDKETLKDLAYRSPEVAPLRDLLAALAQLRSGDVFVGSDNRNRCMLSPFSSKTGRNQPSGSRFIFANAKWMRRVIKPELGTALAYVDWEQQEFGIAAALSGDVVMQNAYLSGDPYLAFAREAQAVPLDATKQSHSAEREAYKTAALGVQYGMGAHTLAGRLALPVSHAQRLIQQHRKLFPDYWRWSEAALDFAHLTGSIHATFGWRMKITRDTRPPTLNNWPMQANGAEMLRIACIRAHERDVTICAPVHDALLIEAPIDEIDGAVEKMRTAMNEASRIVLDGFELRTEVHVVRYPDRWPPEGSARVWAVVANFLGVAL